jgi:hypothetical protein
MKIARSMRRDFEKISISSLALGWNALLLSLAYRKVRL